MTKGHFHSLKMSFYICNYSNSFISDASLIPSCKPNLYATAPYTAPQSLAAEIAVSTTLLCSLFSPAFSSLSNALS